METRQEKIQLEFLERCVKDCKIFIDTSSFLEESTGKFFQNIVPILQREGKAIIMPKSVGLELMKLANNPAYCKKKYSNNPNLNALAINAVKNINVLKKAGLIEIHGDPDDGDFADNVFLHVLTKKRMQYDMLLITQDKGLASEAIRIGKDNRAVHGMKKIFVQRIDKNGFLQKIFDGKESKPASPAENTSRSEIPLNERFAFTKEVTQIAGNMPVTKIPVAGDTVTAVRNNDRRQIQLLEELGAGGEGSVYKTSINGFVAKIYKPEKLTRLRYEKLKLMLSKNINCEGVCFPLALILNQRDEFVGYLMRAASGRDLGKSVFMPMLLKKYFPRWNKIDTVQLCVTILKKLKYLHDRNVILGDINPYNILVVSPTEIYFVDTDSYQVEGFICPVGMPLFTAPEVQGKAYSTFLRTLGNENFAVATLLFMIMHPGKPPYAMQDGVGIKENIISGEFSYPLGKRRTGKVPKGLWRYCWSHLTYQIKETFYETFRIDGSLHDEDKRPNVDYWLRLFENYSESLKSGKEDLFSNPTTRVPICLCLDVSASMDRIVGGQTRDTGRKVFVDGREWNIVEGGVTALQELIEGVNLFYDNLLDDDFARYAAEICIVTFGDEAELIMDFANLDRQEAERQQKISDLTATGHTPMGEAVNMALDCLEARKNEFKEAGVDYYQPWLVLMTDGEPNGSSSEFDKAVARTNDLAKVRKLTIFPIGIGDEADMNCLAKFSPRRPPLKLKGMNFKKFFEWLSASVSRTSQSMPGDTVKLDMEGIKGWAEL